MLEPSPPRRDPRLLALVVARGRLAWAALDAWEVRALGSLRLRSPAHAGLVVARLLVQVKPSAILRVALRSLAMPPIVTARGIPVVGFTKYAAADLIERSASLEELRERYPELRAPFPPLVEEPLRLAAAALVHLDLHRRYAKHPVRSRAHVAHGRAPRNRDLPLPHGRPARRPR